MLTFVSAPLLLHWTIPIIVQYVSFFACPTRSVLKDSRLQLGNCSCSIAKKTRDNWHSQRELHREDSVGAVSVESDSEQQSNCYSEFQSLISDFGKIQSYLYDRDAFHSNCFQDIKDHDCCNRYHLRVKVVKSSSNNSTNPINLLPQIILLRPIHIKIYLSPPN